MSPDNHHTFEGCTVTMQSKSGAALLIRVEGVQRWIPKSLIHDDSECYKMGTSGTLVLPLWFCEKESMV